MGAILLVEVLGTVRGRLLLANYAVPLAVTANCSGHSGLSRTATVRALHFINGLRPVSCGFCVAHGAVAFAIRTHGTRKTCLPSAGTVLAVDLIDFISTVGVSLFMAYGAVALAVRAEAGG